MSDLGRDKAILIVNRQPQCSGCQKVILKFLQSVDTSKVAVAMLFEPMDSYRLRRENDRQMLEIVPKYYKSLYMCQRFDYSPLLTFDSFPAVLFWLDFCWKRLWGENGLFYFFDVWISCRF